MMAGGQVEVLAVPSWETGGHHPPCVLSLIFPSVPRWNSSLGATGNPLRRDAERPGSTREVHKSDLPARYVHQGSGHSTTPIWKGRLDAAYRLSAHWRLSGEHIFGYVTGGKAGPSRKDAVEKGNIALEMESSPACFPGILISPQPVFQLRCNPKAGRRPASFDTMINFMRTRQHGQLPWLNNRGRDQGEARTWLNPTSPGLGTQAPRGASILHCRVIPVPISQPPLSQRLSHLPSRGGGR